MSALPPSVRYQYYQSVSSLNMSVMAKNLAPEDVTVEFTPNHLLVKVQQEGQEGKGARVERKCTQPLIIVHTADRCLQESCVLLYFPIRMLFSHVFLSVPVI